MSKDKIKVGFFIPSLTSGGAERIMAFISQHLNEQKFETILISVDGEENTKYDVSQTRVIYLNQKRVLFAVFKLFLVLKREKFNIAMSSIRHMNAVMGILAPLFRKTKFVGREANVMSVLNTYKEPNDRDYPSWIYRLAYAQLDAIICQSKDMLVDIGGEFPKLKQKLKLINNPITAGFSTKGQITEYNNKVKLVTVASLEPRKGHLRILEGLALYPNNFEYTIIGQGSMHDSIFEKIKALGFEKKINYIPYTDQVNTFLKESHIFIQGSYVEGFPNALLESCAVGTPVIAFNAPGGINEIIEDGQNGFIINEPKELGEKINEIMGSSLLTPDRVSRSVLKKYHPNQILSQYEALFFSLTEQK